MNIKLIQERYRVGAIDDNTQKIIQTFKDTHQKGEEGGILLFPELTLTGYCPNDWLFRIEFQEKTKQALLKIKNAVGNFYALIGHPEWENGQCFNAASIFHQGQCIGTYRKQALPNYNVFPEKRYFKEGSDTFIFSWQGKKMGVLICEDLWVPGLWQKTVEAGAEVILSLNASPFDMAKHEKRLEIFRAQQDTQGRVPLYYVNTVGGYDDLVFDGQSFVMDEKGHVTALAPAFESVILDTHTNHSNMNLSKNSLAQCYEALVMSVRDYAQDNGFSGACLGLSGGIDSALTLAIAVDALGAKNVNVLIMPSKFTADMSVEDAVAQAEALDVVYQIIEIDELYEAFAQNLSLTSSTGIALQNLQARTRGMLLMAHSNVTGQLLLSTGNKSEIAMGYCTLYGDMCGGFAPLKDILKTRVYTLANYRNEREGVEIIPQRVITRAPSAELAPNQKDEDNLPPYDILDEIIERYVEQGESLESLKKAGFDEAVIQKVYYLLHRNEYKRQQGPIGPRVTHMSFGREWQYPISAVF